MQAIELETTIDHDGTLHLPEQYRFSFGAKARVIVLLNDLRDANLPDNRQIEEDWKAKVMRFAGCMGDDFPDDIDDAELSEDTARDSLE